MLAIWTSSCCMRCNSDNAGVADFVTMFSMCAGSESTQITSKRVVPSSSGASAIYLQPPFWGVFV